MKNKLAFLALILSVSSCTATDVRHAIGVSKDAPDEFMVLPRNELVVPKGAVALPAPTKAVDGQIAASENARKDLFGGDIDANKPKTAAELAILKKAGADKVDSSIRKTVDAEYKDKTGVFGTDRGGTLESVLDPFGVNAPKEPIVDAKKENERIKKALAKGESINASKVKTKDPRKEAWEEETKKLIDDLKFMPHKKFNLVKLSDEGLNVVVDLKYATSDNFTGVPVYKKAECFLLAEAVEKLRKAIDIAAKQGYRFKIFDAYRPTEAQQILWDHTPNPDFLAPPEKGSAHSRGVAVDLTLIYSSGKELDMGTEFDAFTPLSYHGVTNGISIEAQKNRLMLLGIMTAAGWDFYKNEWWHYQLFDARNKYPLISDKDANTGLM